VISLLQNKKLILFFFFKGKKKKVIPLEVPKDHNTLSPYAFCCFSIPMASQGA
jgi:hypothetical protein